MVREHFNQQKEKYQKTVGSFLGIGAAAVLGGIAIAILTPTVGGACMGVGLALTVGGGAMKIANVAQDIVKEHQEQANSVEQMSDKQVRKAITKQGLNT